VAWWWVHDVEKKYEDCKKLASQSSFEKGSRVRVKSIEDCEKILEESQPTDENYPIVILYNEMPRKFNPVSGIREISVEDIRFVFKLYNVPEELYYDYYHRLLYFHDQVVKYGVELEKKKAKKRKEDNEWRENVRKNRFSLPPKRSIHRRSYK